MRSDRADKRHHCRREAPTRQRNQRDFAGHLGLGHGLCAHPRDGRRKFGQKADAEAGGNHLDGEAIAPLPVTERKERLRALLSGSGSPLHFSDHQIGRGPAFYDHACTLKVEGIVSKRVDAPYAPGNRGLWLKVKCLNREEFVVVGWTDPEGSRPWLGALLLAYY